MAPALLAPVLLTPALLAAALLITAALWLCGSPARAQPGSLEYPVKAAYLAKFTPFVGWPPRAFAHADSPLVICVVGPDPFGPLLDTAARGQRLGEHPVHVRRLAAVGRDSGCHILFIGHHNPQATHAALKAVEGAPVLTVTDGSRPGPRGIIHFAISNSRVRFHIDDKAAAANGLTISSKLMTLALSVRRRP